jgi:hypothetical protein
MVRPSPVPWCVRVRELSAWRNGKKTSFWSRVGIPQPESVTRAIRYAVVEAGDFDEEGAD